MLCPAAIDETTLENAPLGLLFWSSTKKKFPKTGPAIDTFERVEKHGTQPRVARSTS